MSTIPERKKQQRPKRALTAREKVIRDNQILRDALHGHRPAKIADKHDLSVQHVERVIKAQKGAAREALHAHDPDEVVDEMLLSIREAIAELAEVADDSNGAARTGAIRARLDALERMKELLQDVGRIERDLGQIDLVVQNREIARKIVAVLADQLPKHMDQDAADRIIEVIVSVASGQEPPNGVPQLEGSAEELPAGEGAE